ncbi:hypothetical protein CLOSTMETH_01429 [[Clostridium] methylpentosum DSM 5476]|uniref:Uncharacterized protein n=1 Tax=[Clostridium] methylpentosum DSM 5476 TaxID=537013 RepID=C0EC60_9FIRM|nr:hypothetical protein CLOSTMETH_01429 [[Clostridium] methylpentosum DSM 5476]
MNDREGQQKTLGGIQRIGAGGYGKNKLILEPATGFGGLAW